MANHGRLWSGAIFGTAVLVVCHATAVAGFPYYCCYLDCNKASGE